MATVLEESLEQKETGQDSESKTESEKCILITDEQEFTIDKKLLCSKSVYFNTMFQCEMIESLSNKVTLNEIKPNVLKMILEFIELDKIPERLDEDLLIEVLGASHMIMVDYLYEECCKKLNVGEHNYSKIMTLNEVYQNHTLKLKLAYLQAKHFVAMRQELLHLSGADLDILLSSTTIEATVDEIIDFILCWGKLKEEHLMYLPRLISLVNMTELTIESLEEYLNCESLISNNKEISDVFMETAALCQLNFMCVADNEFRAFSMRNSTWSPSIKIQKQAANLNQRIYFLDDYFYILITRSSNKVEVFKVNARDNSVVSSKKINVYCRASILLVNESLYFISCDSVIQPEEYTSMVFSLYVHEYELTTERFRLLTSKENCASGGVFGLASTVTDIYILVPDCIFQINLSSPEWKRLDLPPGYHYMHAEVHNSFLTFVDHLYYFQLRECTDGSMRHEDSCNENKSLSMKVPISEDKTTWVNITRRSHHVHHMHQFRLVSDDTWEHLSIYKDFPYREFKALQTPLTKLRRFPLIYFTTKDSHKFIVYDLRTNDWKKFSINAFDYWKTLTSLNYIYKRDPPVYSGEISENIDEENEAKCIIS